MRRIGMSLYLFHRHLPAALALAAMLLTGCQFDADPAPYDTVWLETPAAPTAAADGTVRGSDAAGGDLDRMLGPAAPPPTGPWSLGVQTALVTALHTNAGFAVDRYGPAFAREGEELQRAAFDPTLTAALTGGQSHDRADAGGRTADTDTTTAGAKVGVQQNLPTGTALTADLGADYRGDHGGNAARSRTLSWDVGVTQALLRGFGTDANYARLRQAKIDTRNSQYELRGAAETLAGQVEQGYWELALAERSMAIYEKSLAVAEQQLNEVNERIQVGKLAEAERAAAEAEAAQRREEWIAAKGTLAKRRLELLRLIGPVGSSAGIGWDQALILTDEPQSQPLALEPLEVHVAVALRQRADLNQARLQLQRNELDLVQTRDGLLPKLDLFITLGGSRYAQAFGPPPSADGRTLDYTAGLNYAYLLGNRDATARNRRAWISQAQSQQALLNLRQLIELDVRSAYVDVGAALETIAATRTTRELREKTLAIEQEKFRVGNSTSFLVAQAQRDLLASQIHELEAVVHYREALLALYRQEGSLLQRRGIQLPDIGDAGDTFQPDPAVAAPAAAAP